MCSRRLPCSPEHENPATIAADPGASSDPGRAAMNDRVRATTAGLLIVAAALVVVGASLALWLRTTALDSQRWADTVAPLPAEEPVADALAGFIVGETVDEDQLRRLSELLPDEFGSLPRTGAAPLRNLAQEVAAQVIASPAFGRVWTLANRAAHRAALAALDGEQAPALTEDGAVVIDLSPAIAPLREELMAIGIRPPERPAGDGRFEVLTVDERSAAARLVRVLRDAALVLPLLALALAAAAILIHPRRPTAIAWTGVAVAIAGLVTLAGLRVARAESAAAITAVDAAVVDAVADAVARGLVDQSLILAVAGALVALCGAAIGRARARGTSAGADRGPTALLLPVVGPAVALSGLLIWPDPRLIPALAAAALAAAWWIVARLGVAGRRSRRS